MTKVLVGIEASDDADAVFQAAVRQLEDSGGRQEVVVLYVEPLLDARLVFDPAAARESDSLNRIAESYPMLNGRIRRISGDPVATICAAASEESADLILVGSGIRRRRLVRSPSARIARFAPCPVEYLEDLRSA